jgi:FixJ family two-component response regulator
MSAAIVHIVDDDESFLRSMARLLRVSGYKVRAFKSVDEFLAREDRQAPGCVVTDLNMPRRNGFDLQSALASSDNPLPAVFITGQGDIPSSVRAVRAGAEDFLTKRSPKAQLLSAVDRALERDAAERAQRTLHLQVRSKLDALTARERQVLDGVVRGLLNKQIGEELGIAERTVKHHRTMLTQKLGVQSAAELALLVRDAEAV